MTGEWGWKDAWFSEAGLLATAEDECESTEAEQGGGGGLGDCGHRAIELNVVKHVNAAGRAAVIAQEKTELDRLVREILERCARKRDRRAVIVCERAGVSAGAIKAEQMLAFGEPGLAGINTQ